MKIGYARVSTLDQNPDMQREELKKRPVAKMSLSIRSAALWPTVRVSWRSRSFYGKGIPL